MRIKKKNYNEYNVLDNGIWIRNFTLQESPPLDQNFHLFNPRDLQICLQNETNNYRLKLPNISTEQITIPNIVIASDGYGFNQKRNALFKLPNHIQIIGTNGVLHKWNFIKPMMYYVVNNPYPDCMRFMPKNIRVLPTCIGSVRTYSPFLEHFISSRAFTYSPVPIKQYSGLDYGSRYYSVDDYRNPICAAISLAYRFHAKRILIFCHDDCFEDERPAAIKVENNLYTYAQQQISNQVIDAHLKWLKNKGILIGYHADGLKLNNAEYISLEEVPQFFVKETYATT